MNDDGTVMKGEQVARFAANYERGPDKQLKLIDVRSLRLNPWTILGATAALATQLAAHQLPRLIFRWLEDLLTVAASPFDHTGGCRILRGVIARRQI